MFLKSDLTAARFSDADLLGTDIVESNLLAAKFSDSDVRGVSFTESILQQAEFSDSDLRGIQFSPACVQQRPPSDTESDTFIGSSLEDAQFENGADLRNADLSGARLYQTAFTDIRINDETTFGWDDGTRYGEICRYEYDPNTDVSINENVHRLQAAAWTYRRLESLFEENAMNERARNAHIRKQEAQRKFEYEMWFLSESEAERFRRHMKRAVLTLNWLLHRHGESLSQLLKVSFWVIVISGILYSLSGIARENPESTYQITSFSEFLRPEAYLDILNGLYFSVITFTTIGYGDFYPASPLSRLLVGLESLAGALLIALFVFVIGRQVAR